MSNMTELRPGDRILYRTKRDWFSSVHEATVVEISPSGTYVKLKGDMDAHWISLTEIELIEKLKPIREILFYEGENPPRGGSNVITPKN